MGISQGSQARFGEFGGPNDGVLAIGKTPLAKAAATRGDCQRGRLKRREWVCTVSTSAVTLSGGVCWLMP